MRKPKLATHLPAPRELTPAEMARATEEARELRARLDAKLAGTEGLPANVRLR
jgi:hypothetical protein